MPAGSSFISLTEPSYESRNNYLRKPSSISDNTLCRFDLTSPFRTPSTFVARLCSPVRSLRQPPEWFWCKGLNWTIKYVLQRGMIFAGLLLYIERIKSLLK